MIQYQSTLHMFGSLWEFVLMMVFFLMLMVSFLHMATTIRTIGTIQCVSMFLGFDQLQKNMPGQMWWAAAARSAPWKNSTQWGGGGGDGGDGEGWGGGDWRKQKNCTPVQCGRGVEQWQCGRRGIECKGNHELEQFWGRAGKRSGEFVKRRRGSKFKTNNKNKIKKKIQITRVHVHKSCS
jgi:hypothetical protein